MRAARKRAWCAAALALALGSPTAWGDDEDSGDADDAASARDGRDESDGDDAGGDGDDAGGDGDDAGGDGDGADGDDDRADGGGVAGRDNSFEENRFFIGKVDTDDTEDRTLWAGSLTSSSFLYRESGGALPGADGMAGVTSNSPFSRMFTDLRTQLDGKHIAGGRWDLRLDGRGRLVNNPEEALANASSSGGTRVQSGALGRPEAELRELYLVRRGESVDFYLGRQFSNELAIKIDGIRIDIAKSKKWSILGLAGLYPARGSRSLGTDYPRGRDADGARTGRVLPIAAGAGLGYRVTRGWGAVGAVGIVPFDESPRIYLTGSGYLRITPKADLFHLGVIDVVSEAGAALTNLSVGTNYRVTPRVRLNAAVHHVDTETLGLTAQAFLAEPTTFGVVRNDTEIRRISSSQLRGGGSLALGRRMQVELSTFAALRRRPEISVDDGNGNVQTIGAAQGYEVGASATHRNLFRGVRVFFDISRAAGVGSIAYARNQSLALRLGASREFARGRGQWDLEFGRLTSKDDTAGTVCTSADINQCFGASDLSVNELSGNLYFRLKANLFLFGTASVASMSNTSTKSGMAVADPSITSVTLFARAAVRF